jgi:hypothetical protein
MKACPVLFQVASFEFFCSFKQWINVVARIAHDGIRSLVGRRSLLLSNDVHVSGSVASPLVASDDRCDYRLIFVRIVRNLGSVLFFFQGGVHGMICTTLETK